MKRKTLKECEVIISALERKYKETLHELGDATRERDLAERNEELANEVLSSAEGKFSELTLAKTSLRYELEQTQEKLNRIPKWIRNFFNPELAEPEREVA